MSRLKMPFAGRVAGGLFAVTALLLAAAPGHAHQLWIETNPSAAAGKEHGVQVCWGHAGHRESGPRLAGHEGKLTACVLGPGGRTALNLTKSEDCFTARFAPGVAGCHVLGADLQVGIIERELHGIPAKTRIVMYGKSLTRVGASPEEPAAPLGFDVEIVPVGLTGAPQPGDLVTVRVLHKGQPLGGKNVLVSAATSGPFPPSADPRVQAGEWSIEAMADPKTGEATFPLIVGGQHVFLVKYTDEAPGTYGGERNDSSEFSHLRKGDTYERTMYVSTLTVQVQGND